jgi:hypothetical protein
LPLILAGVTMAIGRYVEPMDDAIERGIDRVPLVLRSAGIAYLALGLGFGIGGAVTLDHYRRTGELPMTPWGFRSFAGGPFEQLTPEQFTVLGWLLVGVCATDVVAGTLQLQGRRRGALLGLATDPIALVLGTGFALPFLLAGIPIRAALVLAGRRGWR